MRIKNIKNVALKTLICCALIPYTSCVNKIESDVSSEVIPIKFSASIGKVADTRITGNKFDAGEQLGLFAMLSGNTIDGKRYIDNLNLTYSKNGELTPEEIVFYPSEDNSLDFISYYPYNEEGIAANSSVISVSVETSQEDKENYSKSDFLVADKTAVSSSDKTVAFKFQHKFALVKIELVPEAGVDIDKMLQADMQIIANGFYTQADYDFKLNQITNHSAKKDITPYGIWQKSTDKLTGKEMIIIPQGDSSSNISFTFEWNGKVYSCPVDLSALSSNSQCVVSIKITQDDSDKVQGLIGDIEDWGNPTQEEITNNGQLNSISIPTLSFKTSDVYQVRLEGTVVAEICKEYLLSDNIASQAIVVYPVENKQSQLNKGTVLRLIDNPGKVHGGAAKWNVSDNTLIYIPGESEPIDVIYINSEGSIVLEEPSSPAMINVDHYILRDVRDGKLTEYPIVKIGKQYWMKENLKATAYRDGTAIKKITSMNAEAGYFYVTSQDAYYYTGNAVKENELAPKNWKIPTKEEWGLLIKYIENKAVLLESGVWGKDGVSYTAKNETGFSAMPYGLHNHKSPTQPHTAEGSEACYWMNTEAAADTEDEVVYLKYSNSEVIYQGCTPHNYALFVRCIKE